MKILMISEAYTPIVDGVAVHIQSLSRQLSTRGHKVSVCTIRQRGLPGYKEEDNLKIYRLKGFFQKIPGLYQDHAEKGHPPVRDWLISRGLAQIIDETLARQGVASLRIEGRGLFTEGYNRDDVISVFRDYVDMMLDRKGIPC